MNERIQQLAEQATQKFSRFGEQDSWEKLFAELIVAECVKVAMRSVSDDEPKEAWYLIQEHFGVAE